MYCGVSDLLLGDMPINGTVANGMIRAASDEIDSTLGLTFVLPLDLAAADPTVQLYLNRTAALIASGRIILSQSTASEEDGVHAYGMYLLEEGKTLLRQIASGEVELFGVSRRTEFAASGNGPSIVQEDTFGLVDAFYAFSHRGHTGYAGIGDGND